MPARGRTTLKRSVKKGFFKNWPSTLIVCACLTLVFFLDIFSYLEYKVQDTIYQSPSLINEPEIVVIGIDNKTLQEFGNFDLWNREYMAKAINILNSNPKSKPAVIAVDVLYPSRGLNHVADNNLVQAAKNGGNVVMASYAFWDQDIKLNKVVKSIEPPFAALADVTSYGLVNGIIDDVDGVIRNAFIQTTYDNQPVRSFPYEIYCKYSGKNSIPELANDTKMFIPYSGYPGDFNWGQSFSDIFAEDFNPDFFAGKIVMIGPYASGMMDAYNTPISSKTQMYGVEIHANVVQMLIEQNFKRRVDEAANFYIFLAILFIAVLLMVFLDVRALLVSYIVLGTGFYFFAQYLFRNGHIIEVLYPIITLAMLYLFQTLRSYIIGRVENKKVRETLGKYVDPKLADRLIEMGNAQSNEVGAKRDIAVLFVDIRGFTPMSEQLKTQPELIVKILNEYLEHTANCIFKNGGSVDKFIGDATMALFNGFAPLDDYVYMAVKAAADIVQGAEVLNKSLQSKYGIDIGFGVGIQCGDAIVGNLGPTFRKDYTAIGDTVNTAARLEGMAEKSQILISEDVYNRLRGRICASSIGNIPLKGKSQRIEVYSVKGIDCENGGCSNVIPDANI